MSPYEMFGTLLTYSTRLLLPVHGISMARLFLHNILAELGTGIDVLVDDGGTVLPEGMVSGQGYHRRIVGTEGGPRHEEMQMTGPGPLGEYLAQSAVGRDAAAENDGRYPVLSGSCQGFCRQHIDHCFLEGSTDLGKL